MILKCPECGVLKTIPDPGGKSVQVRCTAKAGGCGIKYYSKKNIYIPPVIKKIIKTKQDKNETKQDKIKTNIFDDLASSSDFKRLVYRALMGKSWRGTDQDLDIDLKLKLEKLKDV